MDYSNLVRYTEQGKHEMLSMPATYHQAAVRCWKKKPKFFESGPLDTLTPYVVCASQTTKIPSAVTRSGGGGGSGSSSSSSSPSPYCCDPDPLITLSINDDSNCYQLMKRAKPTICPITDVTCLLRMKIGECLELPMKGAWSLAVDALLPDNKTRLTREARGTYDLHYLLASSEGQPLHSITIDVSDKSTHQQAYKNMVPVTKMKLELGVIKGTECSPKYFVKTVVIFVKYGGSPCCYQAQEQMMQTNIGDCISMYPKISDTVKEALMHDLDEVLKPYQEAPQKFAEMQYCVRDSGLTRVKNSMNKKIKEDALFDIGNLVNPIIATGILAKLFSKDHPFELHHPKLYDPGVVKKILGEVSPDLVNTLEMTYGTQFPNLHQLLSHTAGLPQHMPVMPRSVRKDVNQDRTRDTTEETFAKDLEKARKLEVLKLYDPGAKMLQSQPGSIILGMILRELMELDTVQEAVIQIARDVFRMNDALYDPLSVKSNADRLIPSPAKHTIGDLGAYGAAGGLYATAEDLSNFSHEFVKKDPELSVVMLMMPLAVISKSVPVYYGYGTTFIDDHSKPGTTMVIMGSRTEHGHSAQVIVYPDYRVSVSYITNVNPFLLSPKFMLNLPVKLLNVIAGSPQYHRHTESKKRSTREDGVMEPAVGLSPGYMAYYATVYAYSENLHRRSQITFNENKFLKIVGDSRFSSIVTDNQGLRQFVSFGKLAEGSYMIPISFNLKEIPSAYIMPDPYNLFENNKTMWRVVDSDGLPIDYVVLEEAKDHTISAITLNGEVFFNQDVLEELLSTIKEREQEIESSVDQIRAGIDQEYRDTSQKIGFWVPLGLGLAGGYLLGRHVQRRRKHHDYYYNDRHHYSQYPPPSYYIRAPIMKAVGTNLKQEEQAHSFSLDNSSEYVKCLKEGGIPYQELNKAIEEEGLKEDINKGIEEVQLGRKVDEDEEEEEEEDEDEDEDEIDGENIGGVYKEEEEEQGDEYDNDEEIENVGGRRGGGGGGGGGRRSGGGGGGRRSGGGGGGGGRRSGGGGGLGGGRRRGRGRGRGLFGGLWFRPRHGGYGHYYPPCRWVWDPVTLSYRCLYPGQIAYY